MRSILKWVGGKKRIIQPLRKVFGEVDCFVEPFVGAGSVFMNTNFPKYILSDYNPDLVAVLRSAMEAPDDLVQACEELWVNGCDPEVYAERRAILNDREKVTVEDTIDRAAIFIYLNRHGYNGLCRYNQAGGYNVPYGDHPTKPYLPKEEIHAFWKRCTESEVELRCCGFEETITSAPKGSLIYADPPYIPSSKTASFAQYHKASFNQQHQRQLAKLLKEAHLRGCRVVLSNSDTLLTKDIYYGFQWETVEVGRYLGSKAETRGRVNELIGVLE